MTFRYFAYGSNLWMPRMSARCPSARLIGPAILAGWVAHYDKPSHDGSAKLNIRRAPGGSVRGVVYEIADAERASLDAVEPGYTAIETPVGLAYAYEGEASEMPPHDWYVAIVEAGSRSHGFTPVPRPTVAGSDRASAAAPGPRGRRTGSA